MNNEDVRLARIGIAGGTFDPIHIGHLIIAEVSRQEFHLDKVIFIPTGTPPHKLGYNVTPAFHRYEMAKAAVMSNPYFEVSPIEVERKGMTYSIDTLKELRSIYSKNTEFFFIIGGDTLFEVKGWKEADQVVKECNLLVYRRPGYDKCREEAEADFLRRNMGASIYFIHGPLLDISSTDIRQRVILGKTIRYMVPSAVEEYIYSNCLYRKES
ncbi:MAG: nicotinate-nucleotide adenylyltransferase [Clostridiales bacterium]|jgi:nicotinate-nucleotide adenylyltransferase|nr:nicotinate-nucleotide adenylyltransferase [Clostridiales bacterium]